MITATKPTGSEDSLQAKGIQPCIPGRKSLNQFVRHDKPLRRHRGIKIVFGRLKDKHGVATRNDCCPVAFLSAIALTATVTFWL